MTSIPSSAIYLQTCQNLGMLQQSIRHEPSTSTSSFLWSTSLLTLCGLCRWDIHLLVECMLQHPRMVLFGYGMGYQLIVYAQLLQHMGQLRWPVWPLRRIIGTAQDLTLFYEDMFLLRSCWGVEWLSLISLFLFAVHQIYSSVYAV